MTAFAYGFRDALEAALIIGFAVAVLVRLERPAGARALWMGAGAGALLGFSIGTGLAAGGVTSAGGGWTTFEIAAMVLSLAALIGIVFANRRFGADSGPCLWLAVGCGLFAALPQTIDLMGAVAANEGGIASLGVIALGIAFAAGLAALITAGLVRVKLGQGSAGEVVAPAGELAPVRQRVD